MDYVALTNAIMASYDVYLYAITGVYFSMQSPGAQVSPRLLNEFERVAHGIRKTFLGQVSDVLQGFQADSGLSHDSPVMSDARTAAAALYDDIDAIAGANMHSLRDRLAGKGAMLADMLKGASGGIGQLLQRKLEKPDFKAVDASGRKWDAKTLMRTMVRDYGYQSAIEHQLAGMTGDLAVVTYADPEHANHGLVFSITGKTPGYPSFGQIRSKIFHPNSTAQVTEHVSP
ncbi:hypothetical protein PQQ87_08670 [Paraburkholderia nemoris]|uniref:hypothetical protein n=1 Tax=Paraburkholderia nemoris TaxID=2793076 RepID=UPI0038BA1125